MRKRLIGRVTCSAVFALGLLSGTAWGDARTEARVHFRKGMAAIGNGNYEVGISELKRANDILPHPNVIYNIARAYVELGDIETAISYYRSYIEQNQPDKEEATQIVAQLQVRLDRQKAQQAAAQKKDPVVPDPGHDPVSVPKNPIDPIPPLPVPGNKKPKGVAPARTEGVYEEAVVTASRGAALSPLDAPSSVAIITEQDIRLSGITKIPELLRRVAGADIIAESGAQHDISMRGLNQRLANKVLVLVDGRSVYVDWFGGTFWETLSIDVDQIERIEVVKGPGSALYGADAVAGVVNIITKAPGTGKNHARLGGSYDGSAYGSFRATGREGNFAYKMSAGYSRYPRWSREVPPGRTDVKTFSNDQNLGSEILRLDARATQRISKDISFGLGGGYSQGFLDFYATGLLKNFNTTGRFGDITAFINTKKVTFRTFYNFQRFENSAASGYVGQSLVPTPIVGNVADAEVAYADKFTIGKIGNAVNAGVNYRLRNAASFYTGGSRDEHHFGLFAQDAISFSKKLELVLSGRLDYVPYTKKLEGSPRGALLYHPTEKSTIRGTFSLAFRKPTFLEGYTDLGVQLPIGAVEANTNTMKIGQLRPERILTAELAYLNRDLDFIEFELAAYYNRVSDLTTLLPSQAVTPSDRLGDPLFEMSNGRYVAGYSGFVNSCNELNVLGGELGVKAYPIEGLDVFANYALNKSSPTHPAGCDVVEEQRTSMHKLNLGVQGRSKIGLDGEIIFHYVSPQDWVERDYDSSVNAIVNKSLPLPGYAMLNARVGYRFPGNRVEASITGFNILNSVHQEHPFTNYVGRRFMAFMQYTF